jgi:hypothetical protein
MFCNANFVQSSHAGNSYIMDSIVEIIDFNEVQLAVAVGGLAWLM